MSPVVVRSDWGYYDALDGVDLKDGEPVTVQWPDGSRTPEVVEVESGRTGHRGLGNCDDDIGFSYARIVVIHHGVEARIRLLDSGCLVERRSQ